MLLSIKNLNQGRSFYVAATHLKAKPGFEERRLNQITSLLNFLQEINNENLPTVIMGDMNDIPGSLMYNKLAESYQIASEYFRISTLISRTEKWTTCKKRETLVKRTIDYIW